MLNLASWAETPSWLGETLQLLGRESTFNSG